MRRKRMIFMLSISKRENITLIMILIIALMLGHTHISEGYDAAGDTKWLAVPSFALDYDYRISDKWSVGLHNYIIIESFIVERHLSGGGEEEILERKYPVSSLVMFGYKFAPHLRAFAGAGAEIAKGENFFMYRFGVEAGKDGCFF